MEIDDYCRQVLDKYWPDIPKYGDIREISGKELEAVDLICGGFPCQPVSLAGKRLAQEDDRWLWPEFIRLVRAVRPRYVLVENVPGLLSRGMGDVLGDLAASGYDAEWDCIPAAAVGAPHLRYRVFIVAHRKEMADPSGQQDRRLQRQGVPSDTRAGCEEVSHPAGTDGAEAMLGSGQVRGTQTQSGGLHSNTGRSIGRRWHPVLKPRLGGAFDGFPAQLDGSLNAWRDGWEDGVPRLASRDLPNRAGRLRALGNAVLPQMGELLGRLIISYDSAGKGRDTNETIVQSARTA